MGFTKGPLGESLKSDLSVFAVTLFVLLPLAFFHQIFRIICVIAFVYLTGAGLCYAVSGLLAVLNDD